MDSGKTFIFGPVCFDIAEMAVEFGDVDFGKKYLVEMGDSA